MSDARPPRRIVISVSSRVSTGIVGNSRVEAGIRLANPSLDVYTVDTVQWTGPGNDPRREGIVLPGDDLGRMLDGLVAASMEACGTPPALLVGYLRTPGQANAVLRILQSCPRLFPVVLDPVMADHGKLYIPEETARIIREEIAPRAHYLLPNVSEANYLSTGSPAISNGVDASGLLSLPVARGVVITSVIPPGRPDDIGVLAATSGHTWTASTPRLPENIYGLGDYFSGLVTGGLLKGGDDGFLPAVASAFDELRRHLHLS